MRSVSSANYLDGRRFKKKGKKGTYEPTPLIKKRRNPGKGLSKGGLAPAGQKKSSFRLRRNKILGGKAALEERRWANYATGGRKTVDPLRKECCRSTDQRNGMQIRNGPKQRRSLQGRKN